MYNFLLLGVLGLLDYDAVEMSNLHRQILHSEGRVGAAKTDSAEIAITRFITYQSRVNSVFLCLMIFFCIQLEFIRNLPHPPHSVDQWKCYGCHKTVSIAKH
jgi:hypothetical protein